MNIRDIFSSLRGRDNDRILRTPYGTFNLAKGEDQARVKHVIMQLQQTTDALTRKDIAD